MTMTKVKVGLALLLTGSLAAGASALIYPARTAKQPEAKQTEKFQSANPERTERARTDALGDPLPPVICGM